MGTIWLTKYRRTFRAELGGTSSLPTTRVASTRMMTEEKGKPSLRPKGRGKALMVSEFLTESVGRLAIPPEEYAALQNPPFPREATEFIEPGKEADGYWTGE